MLISQYFIINKRLHEYQTISSDCLLSNEPLLSPVDLFVRKIEAKRQQVSDLLWTQVAIKDIIEIVECSCSFVYKVIKLVRTFPASLAVASRLKILTMTSSRAS